jgi:DNA-binding CsgD family transcriptional regulator
MAPGMVNTWVGYMAELSKKKFAPDQLMVNGIDKIINIHHYAFNILNHSVPMIYLLDYTTGRYLVVSPQCKVVLDFSSETMIGGGVNFIIDRYHPADLKLFNEQIFIDRQKFLKETPVEQHKDYIFSYNYRLKSDKGRYVNLIQRNSFIKSDEKGNPLLSLGVVTNVDHFREESPVVQLVEKVDSHKGNAEVVLKKTYYQHEEYRVFSKREQEVLQYIAEGLTSKEIADKLFISEHTVINHKRNMHHKSNTQNSAALISFAFRQHLL